MEIDSLVEVLYEELLYPEILKCADIDGSSVFTLDQIKAQIAKEGVDLADFKTSTSLCQYISAVTWLMVRESIPPKLKRKIHTIEYLKYEQPKDCKRKSAY